MQKQFELQLIHRETNGVVIDQRASDGYINATELCKAAGKKWSHYMDTGPTKAFINALVADTAIPASELIQSVKGGSGFQGTWIHPQVATHFGQWLSPEFAVKVSKWVADWIAEKGAPSPHRPELPYHIRRHMMNLNEVPLGYFSVLQEMTFILIGPMDQHGYELPERLVPDISMGRFLCKHLRDKLGIDTDSLLVYMHRFPDGRTVEAKIYPNELLAEFRRIILEDWLPKKAAQYFGERDPVALPYLDKVLLQLPSAANQPRLPRKKKAA